MTYYFPSGEDMFVVGDSLKYYDIENSFVTYSSRNQTPIGISNGNCDYEMFAEFENLKKHDIGLSITDDNNVLIVNYDLKIAKEFDFRMGYFNRDRFSGETFTQKNVSPRRKDVLFSDIMVFLLISIGNGPYVVRFVNLDDMLRIIETFSSPSRLTLHRTPDTLNEFLEDVDFVTR